MKKLALTGVQATVVLNSDAGTLTFEVKGNRAERLRSVPDAAQYLTELVLATLESVCGVEDGRTELMKLREELSKLKQASAPPVTTLPATKKPAARYGDE